MNTMLEKILQHKSLVYNRNRSFNLNNITAGFSREPLNFSKTLRESENIQIIAEIKLHSPSAGLLKEKESIERIAKSYVHHGAVALSILTERHYFNGEMAHLKKIRELYPEVPLLMKDFIFFENQLVEARLFGADAVLLIVKCLTDTQLKNLYKLALLLRLTPVIEVNTEEEVHRALSLNPDIILVNNRDLETLQVDLGKAIRLAEFIPNSCIKICASGLSNSNHIKKFNLMGYQHFLMGTALMSTDDPGMTLNALLAEVNHES